MKVVFIALVVAAAVALALFDGQPREWGNTVPTLVKLISLGLGALFSWRNVFAFERGAAAWWGWLGVAAWFTAWTLGQSVFTYYLLALSSFAPTPSLADRFFVFGYLTGTAALIAFVVAWRSSGLVQTTRADRVVVTLVALACIVAAVIVFPTIAGTDTSFEQRFVVLLYPALDFVMLLPAAVLLRMSRAFGGRVWTVWFVTLSGIVAFCLGDVLYAYLSALQMGHLVTFVDFCFCAGYAGSAAGAWLQWDVDR